MTGRQTRNQVVPTDFQSILMGLRESKDPRLPFTLSVARMNGWTLKSLGDAIGVSREWIRQLVADCDPNPGGRLPDIPLPPRTTPRPRNKPRRTLRVKAEVAEELRAMHAVARTVNGGTPAGAPEREISERLSATLDSLVKQGVSLYHLGQVLGVQAGAVSARLRRHGFGAPAPSQATHTYKGHASYETADGRRVRDTCQQGHPLTGENLYVIPKTGARICRKCADRRRAAYLERKRQPTA